MIPVSSHVAAICGCAVLLSVAAITAAAPAVAQAGKSGAGKMLVYVGGYTKDGKGKGIFIYSMNVSTGLLTPEGVGPDVENPSFLALSPNHHFLYAVNETDTFNGNPGGGVSSYRIDTSTGALTLINERTSGGTGPCHISTDAGGTHVMVANYNSGSAEVLPINSTDGSLGEPSSVDQHTGSSVDPARQEGPHAHCAIFDPSGKYGLVCDLGTDKIVVYKYNSTTGTIDASGVEPGVVAPGSGPRHFVFTNDGLHGYCISEMKSTITAFNFDPNTGALKAYQTISTLPTGFTGSSSCAEIALSPDGRFLYGSNRGHNSLAIFSVSPRDHTISLVGHEPTGGKTPRGFEMDPSGNFLIVANQDSNSLVVFKRNAKTGKLTPTGQTLECPSPASIVFLKQGK
jgi:6-phosphogluconolactonase